MKALFDTNILIDYLNAVPQARAEIVRVTSKAISIISWIEVMVGTTAATRHATRDFLGEFEIVDLDTDIAERAVELRRMHRIKLPDAVIWASANARGFVLITRNVKDFPAGTPGVFMPYSLAPPLT